MALPKLPYENQLLRWSSMPNSLKKLFVIAISLALVLTGCSQTSSSAKELFVPSFCEKTKILSELTNTLKGAKWIDTSWQPQSGSDLDAAIGEGGLACEFGLGQAEIGSTVIWSPDDEFIFTQQSVQWIKDGQVKVDLPGVDESAAYVKTEGTEGSNEYHVWTVNLLYKGFWIQVNATFTDSIKKMMPLVKAAIASLRTKSEMTAENISGCYAATLDGDLLTMKLDHQDRNIVIADLYFGYSKKSSSEGRMFANYTNGLLTGIYQVQLLEKTQKTELFFKGDKSGFNFATGPTEQVGDTVKLKRPLQLTWDMSHTYKSSDKCQPLNLK